MRAFALIMLTALGVGMASASAEPGTSDAASAKIPVAKIPVKERLNSLSPREAARAERSRARAANATGAPLNAAAAKTSDRPRSADARRDADVRDHARSVRRIASSDRGERVRWTRQDRRRDERRIQEARRQQDRRVDDRRVDDRRHEASRPGHRYASRRAPRIGDMVERGVPLYRLPRRYAADYPPYPGADGPPWPRPRPLGFFFYRPNEDGY